MKNRLMLLMVLSAQLGVQAADDQALSSDAHEVQSDTAQVFVEQREQDVLVRYLRDGQEFPPFDANLIYAHTMIKEYVASCLDPMFKVYVKDLFHDLSFDLIKLLIQVLGLTIEETEERLEHLAQDDITTLYEKAIFWRINILKDACAQRLAERVQDIEIVGDHTISQEAERTIMDHTNIRDLDCRIKRRLTSGFFLGGWNMYAHDAHRIFVVVNNRVAMHSFDTRKVEIIFKHREGEDIQSIHIVDSNKLLIKTNKRVIMHIIDIQKQEDIFEPGADENMRDLYIVDSNKVLIKTNKRVIMYTIDTQKQKDIFKPSTCVHIGNLCVLDSNNIYIHTNKCIIKCIMDIDKQEVMFKSPPDENIQNIHIVNGNRMLVTTNKSTLIIPIFDNILRNDLNFSQLQLLCHAVEDWKQKRPCSIQEHEFSIYESLPEVLRHADLFIKDNKRKRELEDQDQGDVQPAKRSKRMDQED